MVMPVRQIQKTHTRSRTKSMREENAMQISETDQWVSGRMRTVEERQARSWRVVGASLGLKHGRVHPSHAGTCDVGTDIESLQSRQLAELCAQQLRVALWRVGAVVLEAVQVFVPLAAHFAAI